MNLVRKILFDNQDLKYKDFNSKLISNIDKDRIIGVRMPVLRKIAKDIYNKEYIDNFLNELPHKYHEENILHGIILTLKYKDIDILLDKLDLFLPYMDNWAVTDIISLKIFILFLRMMKLFWDFMTKLLLALLKVEMIFRFKCLN